MDRPGRAGAVAGLAAPRGAAGACDRWLVRAALACTGLSVAAVASLHGLQSDVDVVSRTLSHHARGPYGQLMTATFFVLAAGLACLAWTVARHGPRSPCRAAPGLLIGLAALGLVVGGLFPSDARPDGRAVTPTGLVHLWSSALSFVALTAGALLLTRRCGSDPRWRAVRRRSAVLALATLVALTFLFAVARPLHMRGLGQRVFAGLATLWVVATALHLRTIVDSAPMEEIRWRST